MELCDIMYHDEWPMGHPSLLFAGLAYDRPELIELWKELPADSNVHEVIRNFPVRQPLLWVDQDTPDFHIHMISGWRFSAAATTVTGDDYGERVGFS